MFDRGVFVVVIFSKIFLSLSSDSAGSTTNEHDHQSSAGGQDEDNVGQLLLARNVLFNDVFDHLDGLTGRIFEDGSQGVDGSVAWY